MNFLLIAWLSPDLYSLWLKVSPIALPHMLLGLNPQCQVSGLQHTHRQSPQLLLGVFCVQGQPFHMLLLCTLCRRLLCPQSLEGTCISQCSKSEHPPGKGSLKESGSPADILAEAYAFVGIAYNSEGVFVGEESDSEKQLSIFSFSF